MGFFIVIFVLLFNLNKKNKYSFINFVFSVSWNRSRCKRVSDNFKAENHHWNLGLHFGGIGQTEDLGMPVFAVSTTIYGFYFDVGVCPSSHEK